MDTKEDKKEIILGMAIMYQNDNMFEYAMTFFTKEELIKSNREFFYLNYACYIGNIKYISELLSKGCELQIDHIGFNNDIVEVKEISTAVKSGNYHVVQYFLENNLIPQNVIPDVMMMIFSICFANLDMCKFFVRKYMNINNHKFMSLVCSHGQHEILKYMIKRGADINYCIEAVDLVDPTKTTLRNAFSDSISSDNIEIVKEVINAGVNIQKWYHTTYYYCINGLSSINIVKYLDKNYAEYTSLISIEDQFLMACILDNINKVKSLFQVVYENNKDDIVRGFKLAIKNKNYIVVEFLANIVYTILGPSEIAKIDYNVENSITSITNLEYILICYCNTGYMDPIKSQLFDNLSDEIITQLFAFLIFSINVKSKKNIIEFFSEKKIRTNNKKVLYDSVYYFNYVILDYLITDKSMCEDLLAHINMYHSLNKVLRMISYLVDKGANVNDNFDVMDKIICEYYHLHAFDVFMLMKGTIVNLTLDDTSHIYEKFYKDTDNKILDIVVRLVKLGYKFDLSASRKIPFSTVLDIAHNRKLFKVHRYLVKNSKKSINCIQQPITETSAIDKESPVTKTRPSKKAIKKKTARKKKSK